MDVNHSICSIRVRIEGKHTNSNAPSYFTGCLVVPFFRYESELYLDEFSKYVEINCSDQIKMYSNPFFPSSITSWSDLSPVIRDAPTYN